MVKLPRNDFLIFLFQYLEIKELTHLVRAGLLCLLSRVPGEKQRSDLIFFVKRVTGPWSRCRNIICYERSDLIY